MDPKSNPQQAKVGGFTEPKPATPQVQTLADRVRPEVERRLGGKALSEYVVEEFRTQVVSGTNYALKIRVGNNNYIHAKVYQPLGTAEPQLTGLTQNKTSTDPLESIPNF